MTSRPACAAKTAAGRRCRKPALAGEQFCATHGHDAPVGAPAKLTGEATGRIIAILRAGGYPETAARVAGVHQRTLERWLEKGSDDDPEHAAYRDFRERVEAAVAEGEARNVAVIARAALDNWQAAAWLLERQHPERWARISQRELAASSSSRPARDPSDPFAEVDELAARRRSP